MPNQPTEDDEGAGLLFNLAARGVDVVEHRRGCGCVTRVEESVVIFSPCGDLSHAERLGLFWKTIAHAHDFTYGIEHPEGESIRELTCGCGWRLHGGTLYVTPCGTEHHSEALEVVSRDFCRANGVELDLVVGPQ